MITVIGCGVIGLTSAVRLAEAGLSVGIVARDVPPDTTSNRAGALWTPYQALPKERVGPWSAASYAAYVDLYPVAGAGVAPVRLREFARRPIDDPFWWRPENGIELRRLAAGELPAGYVDGFELEVPFIHSGIFLTFLMDRFARAGGTVERRELASLADLKGDRRWIVNCTGLGARELVGDATVYPIRGQLAVVANPGGIGHSVDDTSYEPDPAYVLPRGDEIILGGTAEMHDADLTENLATRERIRHRCEAMVPALAGCEFRRAVVGLRPGRPQVRLERENLADGSVLIHNYGHGGSGFTVAWGCADEVLRWVRAGSAG